MSRKMWKAGEAKTGKIRVVETGGRRNKSQKRRE